jgi:hypothetical protein
MTRAELEEAFGSGDGEKIRDALMSACYSERGAWVEGWCLKFSDHPDPIARYGVAVVLGNNAIAHCGEVDLVKCLEVAEKLGDDSEEQIRTAAKDALGDILHAIKLKGTS